MLYFIFLYMKYCLCYDDIQVLIISQSKVWWMQFTINVVFNFQHRNSPTHEIFMKYF